MSPWIEQIWSYIEPDFRIAEICSGFCNLEALHHVVGAKELYTLEDAKKLHKKQYTAKKYLDAMDLKDGYSPARMLEIFKDRVRYVIERGSTLNNPHIQASYFNNQPDIKEEHAETLRKLIRNWLHLKEAPL
jgi:hypothetical protein